MGFREEGFTRFSTTKGVIDVPGSAVSGHRYESHNHINADRTVGFAAFKTERVQGFAFLSRTAGGDVLTIPGGDEGPVPIPLEGVRVASYVQGAPWVDAYRAHLLHLGNEAPMAAEAHLMSEVPKLAQRSVDLVKETMAALMAAMQGAMSDFGDVAGDAVSALAAHEKTADELDAMKRSLSDTR